MDVIVYALMSALVGLMGFLGAYVIVKKSFSDVAILEKIDVIMQEVELNQDFQKRIYMIGALIGKGVIDGTGLKGSRTKKKGLEGLIMEIVGNYIGSKIAPQTVSQQPQPLKTLDL